MIRQRGVPPGNGESLVWGAAGDPAPGVSRGGGSGAGGADREAAVSPGGYGNSPPFLWDLNY
jgi:hypothetical protein